MKGFEILLMSLECPQTDGLGILATRCGLVAGLFALGENLLNVGVVCFDHGYTIAQKEGKINPSCASSSTGSEEHVEKLSFGQRTCAGELGAESHGTCPCLASVRILCIRVVIGTVVGAGSVEPRSDLLGVGEVAHGVLCGCE